MPIPSACPSQPSFDRALRQPVEFAQYTSFDYRQVLDDHRVLASIGTVADALDNALAESFVDSYKTELITDRVWRTRGQVELATVEWVAWFNHYRLHESLGDIPPAESETLHAQRTLIPANGSAAALTPRAAKALTTRRSSTVGLDFAPPGPISAESARVARAGSAQAARAAVKGRRPRVASPLSSPGTCSLIETTRPTTPTAKEPT